MAEKEIKHSESDSSIKSDECQYTDVKKVYYPAQEQLAKEIVLRIRCILWLYSQKKLSDFKRFEFQIYTANYISLQTQTICRLSDPQARCFPEHWYKDGKALAEYIQPYVQKYCMSKAVKDRLKELKRRVAHEPDTLFLIVGDEAHWGQTENGASKELLNCWTNSHTNVLVLQVSATAFNLKTEASLIPNQHVAIPKEHIYQEERVDQVRKVPTEDDAMDGEQTLHLNIVKWVDGCKFTDGVVVMLRIPHQPGGSYQWLDMGKYNAECKLHHMCITNNQLHAMELYMEGQTNSEVEIKTIDKQYQLVTVSDNKTGELEVGFVRIPFHNHLIASKFNLVMNCGEDLLFITVKYNKQTLYLHHDYRTNRLNLAPLAVTDNYLLTQYPLDCAFIVDYYNTAVATQYLSLNFFYNSMRNETTSAKLIRSDRVYAEMLAALVKTNDVLSLAADYVYFIFKAILKTEFSTQYHEYLNAFLDMLKESTHWRLTKKLADLLVDLNKYYDCLEVNVHDVETFKIVKHLLPDEETEGKMVLVKLKSIANAEQFCALLDAARRVVLSKHSETKPFAIVPDFGQNDISLTIPSSYQPETCQFKDKKAEDQCTQNEGKPCSHYEYIGQELQCINCGHVHKQVEVYDDLRGIPSLVVLVKKGQIGDTFPDSLSVIDRRTVTSIPLLSAVLQEFGRLCCYREKSSAMLPLTSFQKLPYLLAEGKIIDFLEKGLDKYPNIHGCFVENGRIDSHIAVKTRLRNLLTSTVEKHSYRILLDAEPQVGKTGVYLKVISLLREEIERSEEENKVPWCIREKADVWMYPLEKDMKDSVFLDQVCKGKYDKAHDVKYTPRKWPKFDSRAHSPDHGCNYRAHRFNQSCRRSNSGTGATRKKIRMALSNEILKISIPLWERYIPIWALIMAASGRERVYTGTKLETDTKDSLQTWICTPSYQRARSATINFSHTMVTEDQRECTYFHFVFVRSEEFEDYCQHWDKTHVIVQLPETMTDISEGVESGIGYARLFIQRFARLMMQDFIFLVDDNIDYIEEICTELSREDGQEYLIRQGNNLVASRIPLFRALRHLEKQLLDDKIQSRAGAADDYGVLGVLMFRPGVHNVRHPFKRTHVYALVLLNLHALEMKKVEYKPLQYREDIQLNRDCNKAGLIVCKYNRFILRKLQLPSNILGRMLSCPEDPVNIPCNDSLHQICEWIRDVWSPNQVEILPWQLLNKELRECKQIFLYSSHTDSSSILIIFAGKEYDLFGCFGAVTGIGTFNSYLILLKNEFFDADEMKWKEYFEDKIVKYMFQKGYVLSVYLRMSWVLFHIVGNVVCETEMCFLKRENEILRQEVQKLRAEIDKLKK